MCFPHPFWLQDIMINELEKDVDTTQSRLKATGKKMVVSYAVWHSYVIQ